TGATSETVDSSGLGGAMVAAAGFDLDGYTDLAIEDNHTGLIIPLNDPPGSYIYGGTDKLGPNTTAPGGSPKGGNGDGDVDLITANQGSLSVLLGGLKGTFGNPTTITVTNASGSLASVVAGDFNGDGKVDLATNLTSGVGIFLGNGNGTFGSQAS